MTAEIIRRITVLWAAFRQSQCSSAHSTVDYTRWPVRNHQGVAQKLPSYKFKLICNQFDAFYRWLCTSIGGEWSFVQPSGAFPAHGRSLAASACSFVVLSKHRRILEWLLD